MRIRVGFDLRFGVPAPTPMLLLLHPYPGRYRFEEPARLEVEPAVASETFRDWFGNDCTRLVAPAGVLALRGSGVAEVDGEPDEVDESAVQHPVQELPPETLGFLLSSRYCEVDKLSEFAWAKFGSGPTGYARAQAVVDFVHGHIKFNYQAARWTKTAADALEEGAGVCRDFAHLSIALCRCLGIPARYATGYLGDIGVPADPAPMDFSAWFEVYLSGRWWTLDARHNRPRIGRIVMAYGRDAADAALTTSFGQTKLEKFEVVTEEVGVP